MFKTKEEIKDWLVHCNIKNYTINDNLTVDVAGDVMLKNRSLVTFPLHFGIVSGNFNCADNQMTSLVGSPLEVGGDFNCSQNKLTSLIGCSKIIKGGLWCHFNELTSLEGCPLELEHLSCYKNKLTSLEGCPEKLSLSLYCSYNQLTSLKGCAKEIGHDLSVESNQISSLEYGPLSIGGNLTCIGNPISSLAGFKTLIGENLKHGGQIKIAELEALYDRSGSLMVSGRTISHVMLSLKLDSGLEDIQKCQIKVKL